MDPTAETPRPEQEPQQELSSFEKVQKRIEEINAKPREEVTDEERSEQANLVEQRTELGRRARQAGVFAQVNLSLASVAREARQHPRLTEYLSAQREQADFVEQATRSSAALRFNRAYKPQEFGGIIAYYYSRSVDRLEIAIAREMGLDPGEHAILAVEPEDWEWQVPPPEPEREAPRGPEARRERAETSQEDERVRGEEGRAGTEALWSRWTAPPDYHTWPPEKQFAWFREQLEAMEKFNKTFRELVDRTSPVMDAIARAHDGEALRREYEAREFLQLFATRFIQSGGFEEFAKEVSGQFDPEYLNTLFRIQVGGEYVVAEAFREYERKAVELDWAINRLTDKEWKEKNPKDRNKDPGTEKARIEREIHDKVGVPWAVELGRRLWLLLERAAQNNVYTEGAGFALGRLDNLREAYLETEKGPGKKFPHRETLWQSWDLAYQNFMSRIAEAIARNALSAESFNWDRGLSQDEKLSRMITKLADLNIVAEPENGKVKVASMADTRVEDIDFSWYIEKGFYGGTHMYKASLADATRKMLMDPGGFLENPTYRNFEMLAKDGFKHLSADDRREALLGVLVDMIDFWNRSAERILGTRQMTREETNRLVNQAVSSGYVTAEQGWKIKASTLPLRRISRYLFVTLADGRFARLGAALTDISAFFSTLGRGFARGR